MDLGLWIEDCGLRIVDCGLCIEDCGSWLVDGGLKIVTCGLRVEDWGLWIEDCGLRIADCGLRIDDWWLRIEDCECGLRIMCRLKEKINEGRFVSNRTPEKKNWILERNINLKYWHWTLASSSIQGELAISFNKSGLHKKVVITWWSISVNALDTNSTDWRIKDEIVSVQNCRLWTIVELKLRMY